MGHPYIANTDDDRKQMLSAIGVKNFDSLVDVIPSEHLRPQIKIPNVLSEQDLTTHLNSLAATNNVPGEHPCFMGGQAEWRYIPAAVGAIFSRGEFLTAYTPYQAEASQGTLQASFEFQTMVANLLGMDVANSGMYDGATSFAEACLMACRLTRRSKIVILDSVDIRLIEVLKTYTRWQSIELEIVSKDGIKLSDQHACIAFQTPDKYGAIKDSKNLSDMAHEVGALAVAHTQPFFCAMFNPPGNDGVDVVTAEGQPLGVPLSYGGSYVGLFACRKNHIRQMPGRIVGETTDKQNRRAFVLTLQAREQHIRREKATSNICTSTQLIALMTTVYLAVVGPKNLKSLAELSFHRAHWAGEQINQIKGFEMLAKKEDFFNTVAFLCPIPAKEVNQRLFKDHKIVGGTPLGGPFDFDDKRIAFTFTEMTQKRDIEKLISGLKAISNLV